MEIYRVTCTEMEPAYFAKFSDIQETLRVSYSACEAVDIIKSPSAHGPIVFTVTGFNPHVSNDPFRHEYEVSRITVLDRATHL